MAVTIPSVEHIKPVMAKICSLMNIPPTPPYETCRLLNWPIPNTGHCCCGSLGRLLSPV
ncbi:hypothetical protein ALP02_200147 [Pseudomonas coronafaciens pv. garcae]|nr:hypothetical protein ALP02_200147 [Pseudomonas coronafaciens pv. garcae]